VDACPALLAPAVKAVIMTDESGPPDEGAEDRSVSAQEQDAALKKLAADEGDSLELAAVLRRLPELLDLYPQLPDTEHVRIVRGLVQFSNPDAFALVESRRVPINQAAFVGHYARRCFAHHHPLPVSEDFQIRAMNRLAENQPVSADYAVHLIDEVANDVLDEQKANQHRLDCERVWNKPDWSVWNVFSWIAFRKPALLLEIKDDKGLSGLARYGKSSWKNTKPKEMKPEPLLVAALARGNLKAIKLGRGEVLASYWFGKTKVDRDTWFDQESVRRHWPGPPEELAGQSENGSYAQAKHAYERRETLNQYKDKLEQSAENRSEIEKADSTQYREAQTASSPETVGPIMAVLELLSDRNGAVLSDVSEAAAARHQALKSALTPERETALRDLETGKSSTLATAKIFRSAPQLLDVLPDIPLVRKVRELVQMLNAPQEWDGFLDPYWTRGQTVLWIVTGDPWTVDQTSTKSGRHGETWEEVRVADLIDKLMLRREHIEEAAEKLWQRCLDGRMTAFDGQNHPISAIEWRHLKIVLNSENVPCIVHRDRRRASAIVPAYSDVVFLRDDVLREFPPEGDVEGTSKDADDGAAQCEESEIRGRRAKLIAGIEQRLGAPALRSRTHYRVTEIVDDRVPDDNPQRRAQYFRAFELAVKAGVFNEGKRQRSQLFCLDAASQSFMRLTKDSLAMYLGHTAEDASAIAVRDSALRAWNMDPAEYRARRLESLARRTWMPRRFVGRWLTDYNLLPVPSWLEDTTPATSTAPLETARTGAAQSLPHPSAQLLVEDIPTQRSHEDATHAAVVTAGRVEAAQPRPCWRIRNGEKLSPSDKLVFETVKELWPESDYTGKAPQKRIAAAIQERVGTKFALSKTAINTARRKFYFGPAK
jgi:hypothetical protein